VFRSQAPPAPRGHPVQAGVRAVVALLLALALPGGSAVAGAQAGAVAAPATDPRALVGEVLYVLNPTTVRTRGSGNLSVDLPRGQSVVLVSLAGDRAILSPGQADASLLRAYGVRKLPRYTATAAQLAADFVSAPAWAKRREEGIRRLRDRWPDLPADRAGRIFLGEPFVGMTEEQAEEAVGRVVLARGPAAGQDGTVAWTVGRRPRPAELRVYTEARERGARARSFEEFLATRTRAVLTFSGGVLVAIESPSGQSPGLNWP
jgi:hypothetical protein